jgi:hypothetical protein
VGAKSGLLALFIRDKTDVKPCQMALGWVQIFPGCALGSLATFCYLGQGVLAPVQRWFWGLREILMALVCFPLSELF